MMRTVAKKIVSDKNARAYKPVALNIYAEALKKESPELYFVIEMCDVLNNEFKTKKYHYRTLIELSNEETERAVGFITKIINNTAFRNGILELMFGPKLLNNKKDSKEKTSTKELIKTIICEPQFKGQFKEGETVPGTVRMKIVNRLYEKNGIQITDKKLRVYLSRLNYSSERADRQETEYGYQQSEMKGYSDS